MDITPSQLREKFREIEWEIHIDSLDDTASFKDQGFDSLDIITMLMFLEKTFSIKIPDSDLEKLGSLAEVARYLNSK